MKTIKIEIVPSDRNWICCIVCEGFNTEFAIQIPDREPVAGIHKSCIELIHCKKKYKKSIETTENTE